VNRLAAIARKHGCPEVAKHIIATQYGFNAMEVQEAFVKITEQAKASLEQPRLYMEGINLLSSQNLDYFNTTHQVWHSRLSGPLTMRPMLFNGPVEAACACFWYSTCGH
jgi:transformation/transcription domain-associated protein